MIRKALGLGLLIIILKFLIKEVFVAGENTAIQFFNAAAAVMSNIGKFASTSSDIDSLMPH